MKSEYAFVMFYLHIIKWLL